MKTGNDSSVLDNTLCLIILATVLTMFFLSYYKYVVNRDYSYQVTEPCSPETDCETDKVYMIDAREYPNNFKENIY